MHCTMRELDYFFPIFSSSGRTTDRRPMPRIRQNWNETIPKTSAFFWTSHQIFIIFFPQQKKIKTQRTHFEYKIFQHFDYKIFQHFEYKKLFKKLILIARFLYTTTTNNHEPQSTIKQQHQKQKSVIKRKRIIQGQKEKSITKWQQQ